MCDVSHLAAGAGFALKKRASTTTLLAKSWSKPFSSTNLPSLMPLPVRPQSPKEKILCSHHRAGSNFGSDDGVISWLRETRRRGSSFGVSPPARQRLCHLHWLLKYAGGEIVKGINNTTFTSVQYNYHYRPLTCLCDIRHCQHIPRWMG
ncbi:unnamed protein product [Lactuca saligna]|uniref:Uncharacterized protein n=1 Tax=Lactuca saligna TaxID=75948 RepID=A0AA35VSD5_LACSI|nr:unnamed protein product [Lactuca saligna]